MVPRKFRARLASSKSGIFESDVKAAFIFASSEADEFNTLLSFEASGLFGLLDIDKEGDSKPVGVGDLTGSILTTKALKGTKCKESRTKSLLSKIGFF